jgi:hypothetical protein
MVRFSLRSRLRSTSVQRRATYMGSLQVVTAVLWLISLTLAIAIAVGGLPRVNKCLAEMPPPPPPLPPPPPPPRRACAGYCKEAVGDGYCDPQCDNRLCDYDGGDCGRGPMMFPEPKSIFDLLGLVPQGRALLAIPHAPSAPQQRLGAVEGSDPADDELRYIKTLTNRIITPLAIAVGALGGLVALASLLSGLFAIGGAASRGACLLNLSVALTMFAAVFGVLISVGAAVLGGLLTAGGKLVANVIAHEFPERAEHCLGPIGEYTYAVGCALLALAATGSLVSIAAVGNCDASCKATTAAADADQGEDESLMGRSSAAPSVATPTPPVRGVRTFLAERRRTETPGAVEMGRPVQMPRDLEDLDPPLVSSQLVRSPAEFEAALAEAINVAHDNGALAGRRPA